MKEKQILVVKCDTIDDYAKACNKFDKMDLRADDGTGKPGHRLNGLGMQEYDFKHGIRYLIQHDQIVKKAMTDKGLKSNKFKIISTSTFINE